MAVLMDRGIRQVVATLAIAKLGATLVPLDGRSPLSRLETASRTRRRHCSSSTPLTGVTPSPGPAGAKPSTPMTSGMNWPRSAGATGIRWSPSTPISSST
ncbi:hypothetical protein E4K10_48165 [Streptomyces sp. T1317-0309]|nr:hypothetical protein E4K10_48165 [Streptomyces sp. T1317-0309]